jgi:hypothetical protein
MLRMTAIFNEFRPFSAKKIGDFLENQCCDFWQKMAVF